MKGLKLRTCHADDVLAINGLNNIALANGWTDSPSANNLVTAAQHIKAMRADIDTLRERLSK